MLRNWYWACGNVDGVRGVELKAVVYGALALRGFVSGCTDCCCYCRCCCC